MDQMMRLNNRVRSRFLPGLIVCLALLMPAATVLLTAMPVQAGAPGIDAFTRHGAGVRAVSMGKAATSIPMGSGSFYWNPAGLGLIEGTEITSLFSQPYSEVDDLQYHTVGFAHRNPSRHVGYGLSGVFFDAGKLRGADAAGNLTGTTFGSRDGALYFSVGAGFGGDDGRPRAAIGGNFKAVRGEIAEYNTMGFGSDIGFMFLPAEWARMGVMVENLVAPTFRYKATDEKFPLRIRGGASLDPFTWMTLAADIENEEGDVSYRFGGEIRLFSRVLGLRGGYTTDSSEFLAGIGFNIKFLALDYAYSTHDDLGQTHRVGLTIRIK